MSFRNIKPLWVKCAKTGRRFQILEGSELVDLLTTVDIDDSTYCASQTIYHLFFFFDFINYGEVYIPKFHAMELIK